MAQILPLPVSSQKSRRQGDEDPWTRDRWLWCDAVCADRTLSHTAKLYATILIRQPKNTPGPSYTASIEEMMAIMGDSDSTVRRALRALEEAGWIVRSGRGPGVRLLICFILQGDQKSVKYDRNITGLNRSDLTAKSVKYDRSPTPPNIDTQISSHSADARESPPADGGQADMLVMFAEKIRAGRYVAPNALTPALCRRMVELSLVTPEQLRAAGFHS